jgi:aspartate kinase
MDHRQVWKLGGSSVDSTEKLRRIGEIVVEKGPAELVVIASAAAGETDRLTREITANRSVPQDVIDAFVATGEMQSASRVAAAINEAGRAAQVMPATLILRCDDRFGDATVRSVNPDPLVRCWRNGIIPVVGGFFAESPDGRICVLGRGGSDYSAVCIGAALRCAVVLLKGDIDAIYETDPRLSSSARRYDHLTYDQAVTLASEGAKVLNCKAAKLAMAEKVTVVVRSTFGGGAGTVIGPAREWDGATCGMAARSA